MNHSDVAEVLRSWPGIDEGFRDTMRSAWTTPDAARLSTHIAETLYAARGTPCALGQPFVVKHEYAHRLALFARVYHRAIETIVNAWPVDEAVRRVLPMPPLINDDVLQDANPANSRVHLCRLDLHLQVDGGFRVLETNANCPGALMSSGIASSCWRDFWTESLPEPLDHELPGWTARWFIENATVETGLPPAFVALLREDGGNRLELPGLAAEFAAAGIDTVEADPRAVIMTRRGDTTIGKQGVRHAYLKLGIQAFAKMRSNIDAFVTALRERAIFVQNGLRGRMVGDNKLCLAILSDPAFDYLFEPHTVAIIREHIPWSRGLAQCSPNKLREINRHRFRYVLKHPFDTRGAGVVIGRETLTRSDWQRALSRAHREGWLVQEFSDTTRVEHDANDDRSERHDLCIGLINGKLAGAFARSGAEFRLNIARSGRLHPVFMTL